MIFTIETINGKLPFLCSVNTDCALLLFLFTMAWGSKKYRYSNNLKLRDSCQEMFYKNGVLKNVTKFIGKHLCWSLFDNKAAGLLSAALS